MPRRRAAFDGAPAPEAQSEAAEDRAAPAGVPWARRIDTFIVVLLAVASLLAAWGGYQAGLWSGEQSEHITDAEAKQTEATRSALIGYQIMQIDIVLFTNWLNAYKANNTALATFYQDRFSPQLGTAFAAWMATDPLHAASAPRDPFRMPKYQVPQLQDAAAFDADAHQAFAAAERAGAIGDNYVLTTLLLATVLFFGGVSTKIGWRPAQLALLGIASLLLLYAVWRIGGLPDGSDWMLTPLWD